jgi:hypothetical protein
MHCADYVKDATTRMLQQKQQDSQCKYKVKIRRVLPTIVAVEKQ